MIAMRPAATGVPIVVGICLMALSLAVAWAVLFPASTTLKADTKNEYLPAAVSVLDGRGFARASGEAYQVRHGFILGHALAQLGFGRKISSAFLFKSIVGAAFLVTFTLVIWHQISPLAAAATYGAVLLWAPFHPHLVGTIDPFWPLWLGLALLLLGMRPKPIGLELFAGLAAGIFIAMAAATKESGVVFVALPLVAWVLRVPGLRRTRALAAFASGLSLVALYYAFLVEHPERWNLAASVSFGVGQEDLSIANLLPLAGTYVTSALEYFSPIGNSIVKVLPFWGLAPLAVLCLLVLAVSGHPGGRLLLAFFICAAPVIALVSFANFRPSQMLPILLLGIGLAFESLIRFGRFIVTRLRKSEPVGWLSTAVGLFAVVLAAVLTITLSGQTPSKLNGWFRPWPNEDKLAGRHYREYRIAALAAPVLQDDRRLLTARPFRGLTNWFLSGGYRADFFPGTVMEFEPDRTAPMVLGLTGSGRNQLIHTVSWPALVETVAETQAAAIALFLPDRRGYHGLLAWLAHVPEAHVLACAESRGRINLVIVSLPDPVRMPPTLQDGMPQWVMEADLLQDLRRLRAEDSAGYERIAEMLPPGLRDIVEAGAQDERTLGSQGLEVMTEQRRTDYLENLGVDKIECRNYGSLELTN